MPDGEFAAKRSNIISMNALLRNVEYHQFLGVSESATHAPIQFSEVAREEFRN